MAESFEELITGKLKVVRDTHRDDTRFNTAVGEDFDKMTFPAASIVPQTTTYQNDLEYSSGFVIRYVFSRDPKHIDWIETLEKVEEATDTVLNDLETDSSSKEFKPQEFQPLVAENEGSRLSIVEVSWETTELQDFT
jgi:hypothetical protein